MVTFEVDGNEYELKLTYKAIKYLNDLYEGGSYELIGRAMSGDLELFPKIVHAGLFHTNKNFTMKKIDEEIEKLIDDESLTLDGISEICNKVVAQSFFYKKTVEKLMEQNPEMKKALEQIQG